MSRMKPEDKIDKTIALELVPEQRGMERLRVLLGRHREQTAEDLIREDIVRSLAHKTDRLFSGAKELVSQPVRDIADELSENGSDTLLHCPFCGVQKVAVQEGPGDFYQGPVHLCRSCRSIFHLT